MRRSLAFLIVLALSAGGCNAGTQESQVSAGSPEASISTAIEVAGTAVEKEPSVFSWDDHGINDWITEAEMTDVLEDLSIEYGDVPLAGDAVFSAREDEFGVHMQWSVGPPFGPTSWTVGVHDGAHIVRDSLEVSGSDLTVEEFLALDDVASDHWLSFERWLLGNFDGSDPRLPEGVRHNGNNFGVYAFWAPEPARFMCVWVGLPEATFGRRVDTDAEEEIDTEFETYEDIVFELASMMMSELGWAD